MKAIGIDLGLEQVVVAIMGPTGPTVLDSFENKPEMRSAVSLKKAKGRQAGSGKEEILVGDTAIDNWPMAPADTIVSIKRLMGRSFSDPEVQRVRSLVSYSIEKPDDGTSGGVCVVMGGRQYTPTDISAQLLARVKKAAEFREGCEITHAVITVPAYFGHTQKDATRKAAIQAGLKVIKILDEPTAAAIAFGADSADGSPQTLLVYDLGGGTFDVSVLMLAGSVFAPLNLQGDMWLGGDDFDQAIIDHALECIREEHGLDPRSEKRFMVELKRAAQKVKERLGSGQNADLTVAGLLRDRDDDLIDIDIPFTRQQFERLIVSMVGRYKPCTCGAANLPDDRTCYVCGKTLTGAERKGKALAIVEKALENAQLTKDQVDFVIMAGNSTMVPLVQESMEREFGANKVLRKIHPKQCVALGAAIAAARIGDQVVCQAPDPTNPKQECGQVNDPDATLPWSSNCSLPSLSESICEGQPRALMEAKSEIPNSVSNGRFKILQHLRTSGITSAYKARVLDEDLIESYRTDIVVLKIPSTNWTAGLAKWRLFGVFRALMQIRSKNVVRYFDVCGFRGKAVAVAEYVEGPSLEALMSSTGPHTPMTIERAPRIAEGVLHGIAALHANHLLHGLIHPNGIAMDADEPKIGDIGRLVEFYNPDWDESPVTHTMVYMSPERLGEQACLASDQWSFAVMFYEMLTGRLPWRECEPWPLIDEILHSDPPAPMELRPGTSSGDSHAHQRLHSQNAAKRSHPSLSVRRSHA